MNYGLGKNSPVKLKLGRENYEAVIERHGQWVRWLQAEKCACVLGSGYPDPNCNICGGDGWKYNFQRHAAVYGGKAKVVGDWICEVGEEKDLVEVFLLRSLRGDEYTVTDIYSSFIIFSGNRKPKAGESLIVNYSYSLIKEKKGLKCKYLGNNVFEVTGFGVSTEYGTVYGDIISVIKIKNITNGEEYVVDNFFRNKVVIDTPTVEPQQSDVVTADISYINPFLFLVVNQSARKTDQDFLYEIQGDAFLTFPERFKVSEGDIITLLVGSQSKKSIITKSDNDFDTLPEFYVSEVMKIATNTKEYVKGTDYIQYDRNRIKWLDGERPVTGENMSVFYDYNPTYKVLQDFPDVRSSENQRLPKRVALKLLSKFGDRDKI